MKAFVETFACSTLDRSEHETNQQFRFRSVLSRTDAAATRSRSPVKFGNLSRSGVTIVSGFFFALNRCSISQYSGNKNKLSVSIRCNVYNSVCTLWMARVNAASQSTSPSRGCYGRHVVAKGQEREQQRSSQRCRESGRSGKLVSPELKLTLSCAWTCPVKTDGYSVALLKNYLKPASPS